MRCLAICRLLISAYVLLAKNFESYFHSSLPLVVDKLNRDFQIEDIQ
jgi:hypothetical protein